MLELFRRIVILIEAMPYLHYIKYERMQEDRICGKATKQLACLMKINAREVLLNSKN